MCIWSFRDRLRNVHFNCEFRAAADLAAYYGYRVDWLELFYYVGSDPAGDPNVGFVGNSFDDPPGQVYPDGYGVYAGPVARGLRELGLPATAHHDQTVEWLRERLRSGNPVTVWVTSYMRESTPVVWQTTDGAQVVGVPGEHTVTVVGYGNEYIEVCDPVDGARRRYAWDDFARSWAYLGNMALTIDSN